MEKKKFHTISAAVIVLVTSVISMPAITGDCQEKPLVLQELTWTDVEAYLKTNDMVIIPIGSIEQHGPHLPLGTDYYTAVGMSNMISTRTGVMVAPVVWAGYSVYHSGFPGSLSLKPETLEQVLFETAEMLISYGFRRIMFFNFHGGNRLAESGVIQRINHSTEAVAVAIGISSDVQKKRVDPIAPLDQHAGVDETSVMLCIRPDLVKMERAEKPRMKFTPEMQQIFLLSRQHPELEAVLKALMAVPEETKKGGASHELSHNGIWTGGDPKDANVEFGMKYINNKVENAIRFIEAWKKVDKSGKESVSE